MDLMKVEMKIWILSVLVALALPTFAQSQNGGVSSFQLLNEFQRNKKEQKKQKTNKSKVEGKKDVVSSPVAKDTVSSSRQTRKRVKETEESGSASVASGKRPSSRKSASSYRAEAASGNPDAQFNLALCYYYGDGVESDKSKAVELLTEAARQDHPEAQLWLGKCYLEGEGVDCSPSEAAKWLKKSAQRDVAEAQYLLAKLYQEGNGVLQDPTLSRQWMEKAAANGWKEAIKELEN